MQAFGRPQTPSMSGPMGNYGSMGRMMGMGGGMPGSGSNSGMGQMLGMGGGIQALLAQLRGLQGGQMPRQPNPNSSAANNPDRMRLMQQLQSAMGQQQPSFRPPPITGSGRPGGSQGNAWGGPIGGPAYGRPPTGGPMEPQPWRKPMSGGGPGEEPYAPDGGGSYQVSEPPPMPGSMAPGSFAGGMPAGLQDAYRAQLATQLGGGGEASLDMLNNAGMGGNQGADYAAMYGNRVGANQGANMTGAQQQMLQQEAQRRSRMNPAIMRMMGMR